MGGMKARRVCEGESNFLVGALGTVKIYLGFLVSYWSRLEQ